MSIAYLSCPYNHPNPEIKEERFQKVSYMAYKLLLKGIHVFSPISHNVPLSRHGDQIDWKSWMDLDLTMLKKCDRIFVLQLEGWDQSKGVAMEISYAKTLGLPIEYIPFPEAEYQAQKKECYSLQA